MPRAFGNSPIWLNEGMAEYFSSLRFEDGEVFVGYARPERAKIPANMVPSAAELVSAGRASFCADESDPLTAARFYAGAWLLVHFFYDGPEPYRLRFEAFMGALAAGHAPDDAWRTAMAGVTQEQLEEEFRKHMRSTSWLIRGGKTAPLPCVPLTERRMLPAEVHLLWARIAMLKDGPLAAREIGEAAALAPASPEVAYARGCFAVVAHQPAAAVEAFRAAASGAPDDPRFLYALAVATGDCGATSEALVDARLCESLVASARSPEENTLAALYLRLTGHKDEALRRTKAAVRDDARCEPCAESLVDMLVADGNYPDAIAVLERATSVSVETPLDRKLAASLKQYRMMQPTR
jgi:Flp pilus assembly protein TadD